MLGEDLMTTLTEYVLQFFESPLTKGSFIGSTSMFLATPGLNATNCFALQKAFPWSRPFTGGVSYASVGTIACGTSFTVKSLLKGNNEEKEQPWQTFWRAATAGAVSGFTICPSEATAQYQLETGASVREASRFIYNRYGVGGFFRGSAVMAGRESLWVMVYMAAAPFLSKKFQEKGLDPLPADGLALTLSAGLFGPVSIPLHRVRGLKQESLSSEKAPRSYPTLFREVFYECPTASASKRAQALFRGAGTRALTSGMVGGLFFKGGELYDKALQYATDTYRP